MAIQWRRVARLRYAITRATREFRIDESGAVADVARADVDRAATRSRVQFPVGLARLDDDDVLLSWGSDDADSFATRVSVSALRDRSVPLVAGAATPATCLGGIHVK